MNSRVKNTTALVFTVFAVSLAPGARATLVANGDFEVNSGTGQLNFNTSAPGWSTPALDGSYNWVFAPGTADTTGANGQYGNLKLWGPGTGSPNGLPATSPSGGYYLAADADFPGHNGAIWQTINGLTVGQQYTVSFNWAASQQYLFGGDTRQQWQVSLGGDTQSTPVYNLANHGFSGWMQQSFTYTATSTSEVLSFFAVGSPAVPPMTLLDGVQMSAVPEPTTTVAGASALLLLVGGGVRGMLRKKTLG